MENRNWSQLRVVPDPIAQHYSDIHEMIYELERSIKIVEELIARLKENPNNFDVIEWSLWSAALTCFFKQFSSNDGRKLKIDHKQVFKDSMGHDDYKYYYFFRSIRDGYIAHANNQQNRIVTSAMLDEEKNQFLGVTAIQAYHVGREENHHIETFRKLVQIALAWANEKRTIIGNVLNEKLLEMDYEEFEKWDQFELVQPDEKSLRANSRKTI